MHLYTYAISNTGKKHFDAFAFMEEIIPPDAHSLSYEVYELSDLNCHWLCSLVVGNNYVWQAIYTNSILYMEL